SFFFRLVTFLKQRIKIFFINAVRKNENVDESFLDKFERLNKEYFYTLFKKGYKPKKEALPEWIRWISKP
ncbi:hypothetical protein ACI3RH_06620, partial [Lactococcus lactis]